MWYKDYSNNDTQPVGTKKPNDLGIFDMCGNVFEMCWDWYDYYPSPEQINPKGPQGREYRVMRGGYYAVWGGYLQYNISGR